MKSTQLNKAFGTLALASLGLLAGGAQAGWDHESEGHHVTRQSRMLSQAIDARQDRQMDRIRAGMHEGRLSRAEFRELMHEQREIRAMERHFQADDILDAREYRRLDHALDAASRRIRAQKHDREEGYASPGHPQHPGPGGSRYS